MLDYLKILFSGNILWYALIVGCLLSMTAALLGVTLVLKKYAMIGDGLSHVSFAALSVAVATGQSPMAFSLPVVALTAFLLLRLSEGSKIKGDAAVAVVSAAALAIGAIAARGSNIDIESYMFGSIVAVSLSDVILTVLLAAVVIAIYVLFYNRIFAITFDETYVKASGEHTWLYNAIMALLTALAVVVGLRLVGALLISALIIFPALTAMRLFKSFRKVVIAAAIIGVVSFLTALFVSVLLDAPTGACVVLFDLVIFGMASLIHWRKTA